MRRDLIIGLLVSICFHGGMGWGPKIWAALFPTKEVQVVQTKTEELTFWTPPPLPDIPPDPTEDQKQEDVSTIAPPSLLDVPSTVQVDSFTEIMAPPPPPSIGKPDGSMMTVPKGNFGAGGVKNTLGQIFNLSDLDQKPEIRGIQAEPVYPTEMKRQGISGEVQLQFVVDSNGDVQNVEVIKSTNREFEQPAIQAVQKWKFKAGRKGGKPVNTRMAIPIAFNLNDEDT